jgi:single-strand DNA-binding protein
MAGVNKVIVVGNLGRDPEARFTQGGLAICKLSVAVTERVKDGDAWKDETEWVRVTVFGKTAENAAQYLQKGRQVYVEGRLKTDKYKDKDGVEKTSVEVIASNVVFLAGGGDDKGGKGKAPAATPGGGGGGGGGEEDLPFACFEPCY